MITENAWSGMSSASPGSMSFASLSLVLSAHFTLRLPLLEIDHSGGRSSDSDTGNPLKPVWRIIAAISVCPRFAAGWWNNTLNT